VQDYGIFELEEPTSLIGKSLREMDLINRFGIQVLAVRDKEEDRLAFIPRGDYVVRKGDVLILLGTSQSMERLTKSSPAWVRTPRTDRRVFARCRLEERKKSF